MNHLNNTSSDIEYHQQIGNEDRERRSKIYQMCQSPELSNKERKELSNLTQEFGDRLSGPYVWDLLHQDNNEVTVYKRTTDPSCFTIFNINLDEENKEIILHLKAICSESRKRKGNTNINLLINQFSKLKTAKGRSDGDYALFDLEYRLRTIMASNEFRDYTARIILESINKEYVVAYYVKNGFNFDNRQTEDRSLVPMQKTLQNTREWEVFLQAFETSQDSSRTHKMKLIYQFQKEIFIGKKLVYKGENSSGQNYFVYADGSYSYLNRDWCNRLSSIYHRERDGTVDFVRLDPSDRRTEEPSDEEFSDEEIENDHNMEEEDQTKMGNGH